MGESALNDLYFHERLTEGGCYHFSFIHATNPIILDLGM